MFKGFRSIFIKELKELIRDPKILIGIIIIPVILFPALGAVLGYAQQTAIEQAQKTTLLVVDNDNDIWSQNLINYLETAGAKVTVIKNITPQQLIDQGLLTQNNASQFVEIPAGFTQNITRHFEENTTVTAKVNIYGEFSVGGIFSSIGSAGTTN